MADHDLEIQKYHEDSLVELQGMLEDEGFIAFLERQPRGAFTEAHKSAVRRLSKWVGRAKRKGTGNKTGGPDAKKARTEGAHGGSKVAVGGVDGQDKEEGKEEEGEEEASDDWKAITDVTEFAVDKDTLEHLQRFEKEGDVAAFLLSRADRTYPAEVWGSEDIQPVRSFASLLINTDKLSQEMNNNHKLWLFHMLLWYHVKEMLVPGGGTGHTFAMGQKQVDALRQQLVVITQGDSWPGDWPVDKTLEHVRKWAKLGHKIDILTGEFGPGCLFVLHKPLTESFLLRKITKSGKYHDAAVAHLKKLQLPEYLASERLDSFGEAIVNYLLRPFAEAKRSDADQTYSVPA